MFEIHPRRSADRGRVLMLASVVDVGEAVLCREGGADVIDCKDPLQGALGAVPVATARAIVDAVGDHVPVSATIGDHPCEAAPIVAATQEMAGAGVDYVKVGLAPGVDVPGVVRALGMLKAQLGKARLVGVLFADTDPDFRLVGEMAQAGFAGVVLDTANKSAGSLPDVMAAGRLKEFIDTARRNGLFCGLAGSLRARDIPALVTLAPDLIGFRGALCRENKRTASLDGQAVAGIRSAIPGSEEIGTERMITKTDNSVHEERAQ